MANSAMDAMERYMNRARYTEEQRTELTDQLTAHTMNELKAFVDKHDIDSVGMRGSKVEISRCIIDHLSVSQYDYDLALSMVMTPSSYVLKDGD